MTCGSLFEQAHCKEHSEMNASTLKVSSSRNFNFNRPWQLDRPNLTASNSLAIARSDRQYVSLAEGKNNEARQPVRRHLDQKNMNNHWFTPALIGGALLGWLLATVWPDAVALDSFTASLQSLYLAALKMIIAPLIFFSLISGVLHLRGAGRMGRLGALTVTYYLGTSAIAILIGLIVVFFIHPWTAHPPLSQLPDADHIRMISTSDAGLANTLTQLGLRLLDNPFNALAQTNILGILAGALLFGCAAAVALPEESKWPGMIEELTGVIYKIAQWVISLLPLGLFAIVFQLTGQIETTTMLALLSFAAVVFAATLFHGLVVLPLLAWWLAGIKPWQLLPNISQPMLTALLTSSSAATLPLSLTTAVEKLKVSRAKASFILPLGATANMDGTALFEGIAVIFLAYMFGVELDTLSIVIIFLVTMLAATGAPGIPSGSMAGLQVVLLAVGIPLEAIALVLLIERPLDTFRTAVNVEGDLIGAAIMERWS